MVCYYTLAIAYHQDEYKCGWELNHTTYAVRDNGVLRCMYVKNSFPFTIKGGIAEVD